VVTTVFSGRSIRKQNGRNEKKRGGGRVLEEAVGRLLGGEGEAIVLMRARVRNLRSGGEYELARLLGGSSRLTAPS